MVRHTGEDFIDVESIAIASVVSLHAAGINGTELDAPETDRFSRHSDASFSEQVLNITMTEIEAKIKPDGIGNNIRWESVAFVCVHEPILPISVS